MYTYSIDPYVIYMLTFEGICDDNSIKFWDYKSSSYITKPLNNELLVDLYYFKNYLKLTNSEQSETERTSQDDVTIRGTFIFSYSPTNIYNRFKRKFSNMLPWFNFTPKNVIELSKSLSKPNNQNYYPKITNTQS